jgi:hypothetical protein
MPASSVSSLANASLKKDGALRSSSLGRSASRGSGTSAYDGRVDELSSAANMTSLEMAPLNAGDSTPSFADASRPSGSASSTMSPATGLSESRH